MKKEAEYYRGSLREDGKTFVVRPDGTPLPLKPSLALRNHSPSGFQWGYGGSGPSQLAHALLLDRFKTLGKESEENMRFLDNIYQAFKRDIISALEIDKPWRISLAEIDEWILTADAADNAQW